MSAGALRPLCRPALVAALVLAGASSLSARAYTVKQDGTGDFRTLSEAVAAVKAGETIEVYPGIYKESVDIDRNRPGEFVLRAKGKPGEVVWDATGLPFALHVDGGHNLNKGPKGITIKGFKFILKNNAANPIRFQYSGGSAFVGNLLTGSVGASRQTVCVSSCPGFLVQDNHFQVDGAMHHVEISWSTDAVVRGNRFTGAGGVTCIKVAAKSNASLIEHNFCTGVSGESIVIRGNGGDGPFIEDVICRRNVIVGDIINLRSNTRNIRVENNTVVNGCISIYGDQKSTIVGNIVYGRINQPAVRPSFGSSKNTFIDYNLFYHFDPKYAATQGIDTSKGGYVVGSHNLVAAPRFMDIAKHDYRLKPGSPAIDSGDPSVKEIPAGGGERVDIGAFEFVDDSMRGN